ncbi:tetratricopeptide repeat protein [Mucilaginibacter pallidiroseus]|uniref:Tetratricopeptide repeat protein n=1 Tax=Mucilaginibacter pallidiroseus TaxID=2599295 RepID=A0A563UDB2_9SPHI|nr:tetratricopeptide repeat protein [Mucilaginibacter pallidiroseus]TWR29357.1 tetratricopeptide repeat protein [Mucilaginibacter pallidiroseus]
MIKLKYVALFAPVFVAVSAQAQQNPSFQVNRIYQNAGELMDKGKFASAAEQYRLVERSQVKTTSSASQFESELSLLKENAQYYEAVCALELGNDDAESMFTRFIKEHPENPLAKAAFFQVGKSYFKQGKFAEALVWFNKVNAGDLSGGQSTEYKFRKGYAYFVTNDYKNAQLLFSEVKNKRSPFTDDATYYYAYIAYLNKDYRLALANFERLKNSKKYEASYPYYITAVYFLDKRYNDVISYAIPIINSTKQQHETEMLRIIGASYFAKGDYDNAVTYYSRFQEQDQNRTQNTQDNYQIGYTYYKVGNNAKAATELQKLVSKEDNYAQSGSYTLGDVFLKLNNKQSARSAFMVASRLNFDKQIQEDALFQYAKLSYELDFNNQALEATRTYLRNYPRSARTDEVKTLLGEALLNSKNYREAVEILEPIPNKSASAQAAYQKVTYFRGLEFYNERAFENAIGIFLRSLANPVDEKIKALTLYWMAESMYEVRKYTESVENFEAFLAMPESKQTDVANYANYALAYAAFYGEQYRKAANYFERFLAGNTKDKYTENDAISRLGDSYFVMKNYSQALANYNKIIAQQSQGQDYAFFQRGNIQGLQGSFDTKIATMNEVLTRFPNSDYADDASFEIAYTYFLKNDGVRAKSDLMSMMQKYPRSSYIPRALTTIGLIDYNAGADEDATNAFKRVVAEYPSSDEAKTSLKQVEKIYTDKGDAQTFINYAGTTGIGNYTTAEQESIMYTAANNLYLKGDWQGTVNAVSAYFDKFPTKQIYEKESRYIRAQALVNLGQTDAAIIDYNVILNDWTSAYSEKSLISMAKLYINQKKYNDAVVFLKRLETNSEYKADYTFAINNLLLCYSQINMADDVIKYVKLVRENEKSSQEDKFRTGLYAGKAQLQRGDTEAAIKEFNYTVANTKTIAAAEAKYNIALIEYNQGKYKASQKTCFDLAKELPNYDYWIAKTFILLADNYVALKDDFQAKATLQSVIENYKGNDDILPTAKKKLQVLSPNQNIEQAPAEQQPAAPAEQTKPDTTQQAQPVNSGETKPAAAEETKPENKEQ